MIRLRAGIDRMPLQRHQPALTYATAVAIALAAVILRATLAPYLTGAQFITFYPAVVLSAYLGGRRPGLLTAAICGVAGWYFFVSPLNSFWLETTTEAITLFVYFTTSTVIALLIGDFRSARQREYVSTQALRASEEQFRILADSSPALIWVTDDNAKVTFANRRYEDVFGQPASNIEGEGWRSIVHPEDVDVFNASFLDALTVRKRFVGVVRVLGRDDQIMWLHCEGVPRFTADGTFLGYVGANLDISEGKRAEEQLRQLNETLERRIETTVAERQLLAKLVEDTDAFVQVADLDFRWLAINKAAADEFDRIYGVRPNVGDSMLDLLAPWPQHQAEIRKVWGRALAGEAFTDVQELGNSGRDRRSYEMKYHVLRDAAGETVGAYQFAYDVSDRVQEQHRLAEAEAARREADALYRTYFDSSPESLFVIGIQPDGDFVVEQVNPAHEAGVGFKAEDVLGRRVAEILPADEAAKVLKTYRHVVMTRAVYQYREVFNLDGTPQHWDTSLVPMVDANDTVIRLIGSSRNVTRQVMAEEALRQSQKMEAMGQLTGGVAHDFNNLLTPILGSLDMLHRKRLGGEREQLLIAGAMQSAERAKTLVQRLLAFARRQPLQAVPVDIAELVQGMADLVSSTIGPHVEVIVEIAEGLPPAKADPNQLEMAVLNLAVNARDAMAGRGTLRISARSERIGYGHSSGLTAGQYICLSVADNGAGMDEVTLARAVEPFFSTKGIGKGTGLGLSMVHGLASQLGGALTIQSRPGFGTNVELWLLESADVPIVQPALDPDVNNVSRGTALLVDDEELVRLSTAHMLHDLGYRVIEAASAEEAMQLIEKGLNFHVLITDHLMPGMNGADLARAVQNSKSPIPVLLVSGYAEGEGIAADLPRLTKPFRRDELASSLLNLSASS